MDDQFDALRKVDGNIMAWQAQQDMNKEIPEEERPACPCCGRPLNKLDECSACIVNNCDCLNGE